MKKIVSLAVLMLLLQGCASLYHVQVGEIDNRDGFQRKPIEVKVSETGVDLNDVKAISQAAMGRQESQQIREVMDIIGLFQMGPQTGGPVYSIDYIRNINQTLRAQCPNGNLTGLMMIRENRKYPVISGEIVKIKGDCLIATRTQR